MPLAACWAPVDTVSFTDSAAPFRDVWLRGVRFDRAFVLVADRDLVLLADRGFVLLADRGFVLLPDRAFVLFDWALVVDDRLDRPFALDFVDRDRADPEDPEPFAVLVFAWAMRTLLRVDVSLRGSYPVSWVTMHTNLRATFRHFVSARDVSAPTR